MPAPILIVPVAPPGPPAAATSTPQALVGALVWDYLSESWSPNATPPQPVPPGTQVKLHLDTTLGEVGTPQVALDDAPIYVKTDNNGFWSVYLVPSPNINGVNPTQGILTTADFGRPNSGDTGSTSLTQAFQAFQWGVNVTAGSTPPTFYLDSFQGGAWVQLDGPIGGSGVAPVSLQGSVVVASPANNSPLRIRWTGTVPWGGSLFINGVSSGPLYRVQTSDRVYRIFVPPWGGQSRKLIV